jgi:hypothetical protein
MDIQFFTSGSIDRITIVLSIAGAIVLFGAALSIRRLQNL